mmetsp:Transcript_85719/g.276644  ORF Transcript_85719/g.276644 Transcript_85719/m.276644 type:complete len:142 (-) Transcript_85719:2310-2735(-)
MAVQNRTKPAHQGSCAAATHAAPPGQAAIFPPALAVALASPQTWKELGEEASWPGRAWAAPRRQQAEVGPIGPARLHAHVKMTMTPLQTRRAPPMPMPDALRRSEATTVEQQFAEVPHRARVVQVGEARQTRRKHQVLVHR